MPRHIRSSTRARKSDWLALAVGRTDTVFFMIDILSHLTSSLFNYTSDSFLSEPSGANRVPKKATTNHSGGTQDLAALVKNKRGVFIVPSTRDLQFTTSRYTDTQIFAARHTNELEISNSIYLRIDAAQRGLGTGSCGPQTLPEYRVNGESYRIAFWMTLQRESLV
mmetsp:Transcript_4825/g.10680  ORF Transcript_4825/g.10680 Transcript_4825/m.10680 type:complete len:166 (+) Transcript_4825:383-880(+)